jgi:hypothetical protein
VCFVKKEETFKVVQTEEENEETVYGDRKES